MKTSSRLQEIADVGIQKPAVGDQVVFDGKAWVNRSSVNPTTQQNAFYAPAKLLVYYGEPIAFQDLWSVPEIIMRIAKWDIWVCGAGYENPQDPNYSTTIQIIAGVRALGTKVFGYVTIGGPPLATEAEIQQNVTWWADIGVDGIFFDSAGFDFTGVTRSLQIVAKQAAKSYTLPVAWNSYYFEHVAADSLAQVTWPSNATVYTLFQNGNPSNLPLPRDTGDIYVFEDFGCDTNGVYASDPSNSNMSDLQFHQKAMQVVWAQPQTIFGQSATPPNPPLAQFEVWAIVTLPEVDNTGQIPNYSILGNLQNLQQIFEYFWACVYLYTTTGNLGAPFITAVCISGSNYGSWGYILETPRMALPDALLGTMSQNNMPVADYTHHTFSRQLGPQAVLEVVTNLAAPPNPPTLSAVAGNLPPGTYYYRITRFSTFGETLPSTEVSITLSATGGVLIDWGATSASGWEKAFAVYGRTSGGEQFLQKVPTVNATNWTDNGTITPAGNMPIENTAYEFLPRFSNLFFTGAGEPLQVGTLSTTGNASVAGELSANSLSVTGSAVVGGPISSAGASINGTLSTTGNASVGGELTTDTLNVTTSAVVGGTISSNGASINGAVAIDPPYGFVGDILALEVNGVSKVTVDQSGNLVAAGTVQGADATPGTQDLVPISQADTRYAAIAGSASQTFEAADASPATQEVLPISQADGRYAALAGSLSTSSPVSGTVYQNGTGQPLTIILPVTYSPTTTAAATMTPALGSTSTPGSLPAESEPAGLVTGRVRSYVLRVPAGWYYSFTAVNATLGTAQLIQG